MLNGRTTSGTLTACRKKSKQCPEKSCRCSKSGAYNNRNGPERTGMGLQNRNGHQINCFMKLNLLFYLDISVSIDIAPFEVHMSSVSGLLHG